MSLKINIKKIDCLLINPRQQGNAKYPPISLIYLASYAREKGYNVHVYDAAAYQANDEQIIEVVKELRPVTIGLTFMTPQVESVKNLSLKLNQIFPDIIQIAGGVHVNVVPEQVLMEFKYINYLVIGEGEKTFVELLKNICSEVTFNPHSIKGIAFIKDRVFEKTTPRELITNLDSLSMPAWDVLPISEYKVSQPGRRYELNVGIALTISSSRGCPYRCQFCASHSVFPRGYRGRSVNLIGEELEYLYTQYKVSHFFFVDEVLFQNKKTVLFLTEEIKKRNLNIQWAGNARVDSNAVCDEVLEQVKEAGCVRIDFGVESGSSKILKDIKKEIQLIEIYKKHRIAHKHGIATTTLMMVGHPNESIKDIRESLRLIAYLESDYPEFGAATPFPGTELFDIAKKNNWLQNFEWANYSISSSYRVMRNKYFNYSEINQLANFTNLIARIWSRLSEKKRYFPEEMKSSVRQFFLFYFILLNRYKFVVHEDFSLIKRKILIEMYLIKDVNEEGFNVLLQSLSLQDLIPSYQKFNQHLNNSSEKEKNVIVIASSIEEHLNVFLNELDKSQWVNQITLITYKKNISEVKTFVNIKKEINIIGLESWQIVTCLNQYYSDYSISKSKVFYLINNNKKIQTGIDLLRLIIIKGENYVVSRSNLVERISIKMFIKAFKAFVAKRKGIIGWIFRLLFVNNIFLCIKALKLSFELVKISKKNNSFHIASIIPSSVKQENLNS